MQDRFILRRSGAKIVALAAAAFLSSPVNAVTGAPQPMSPNHAQKCSNDLTAFDGVLQKDGYWLHESGYGYGYPMYGYGYAYAGEHLPVADRPEGSGYWRARPGYEVRTLMASANILAQRGEQQACESLLATTREIYTGYVTELRAGKVARADTPSWKHQQISMAVPVASIDSSLRSDQLVGAGVVNEQGSDLGSIDDIVMSPKTGKIAYLVVGRGGIFGIGKKYVPVPWDDFKVAPGAQLLVLDATKTNMDAAPEVKEDQFSSHGDFAAQSQKVADYWSAHPQK